MEVLCIAATKNRHAHLEKLVRCFLDQDYQGKHTLFIFNNAKEPQRIEDNSPPNKRIILINNHLNSVTGKEYDTLGEVYNDILNYINIYVRIGELSPELITHMDDDDIYLPSHISEGVKGYLRGQKKAYKPSKSYFVDSRGVHVTSNVMEPSIFVNYQFLKEHGYYNENKSAHLKWVDAASKAKEYFIDDKGVSTFVYDWSGKMPVIKISGAKENRADLQKQTAKATDVGDGVITPMSREQLKDYLNKINFHHYG